MSHHPAAQDDPGERASELLLVERARRGSREAFGALVRRTRPLLEALIARVCSRREDIEDLAQEAYVRAWTRIGGLRDAGSFRTWIGRIAVNLALNATKRASLRKREAERARPSIDGRQPEREPLAREALELLDAALQRVPPRRRLAFHLRVCEGLGHDEIAAILGIGAATSRIYVSRAREQLARELAPHRDLLAALERAS